MFHHNALPIFWFEYGLTSSISKWIDRPCTMIGGKRLISCKVSVPKQNEYQWKFPILGKFMQTSVQGSHTISACIHSDTRFARTNIVGQTHRRVQMSWIGRYPAVDRTAYANEEAVSMLEELVSGSLLLCSQDSTLNPAKKYVTWLFHIGLVQICITWIYQRGWNCICEAIRK